LSVPVSWPGGDFDTYALKAASKWRYTPPKDETGGVGPIDGNLTIVKFIIKG
jgi:hypothetical protein